MLIIVSTDKNRHTDTDTAKEIILPFAVHELLNSSPRYLLLYDTCTLTHQRAVLILSISETMVSTVRESCDSFIRIVVDLNVSAATYNTRRQF